MTPRIAQGVFRRVQAWASKGWLHIFKWGLITVALVLFFCDIVTGVWPSFGSWWDSSHLSHIGIGGAAFAAFLVEIIHDEVEEAERIETAVRPLRHNPKKEV